MSRIVQILPIVNPRDAIGKLACNISRLLSSKGFMNVIVAEKSRGLLFQRCHGGLNATRLETWAELSVKEPDVLIYHHSIGTQVADHFVRLSAQKKIVIYHGITPPELLDDRAGADSRKGTMQLRDLVSHADCWVTFSQFTAQEIREVGGRQIITVPYYLPWRRGYLPIRRKDGFILVVGRVVKHKRVREAIEGFAVYHRMNPCALLGIVGSLKGDPTYVAELCDRDLRYSVRFYGKISQWHLQYLYRRASVLLVLSEHEGFGVPVIEAMRAGALVVAKRGTALAETVGEGGVLVDSDQPAEVAAALTSAQTEPLRSRLKTRSQLHLAKFTPDQFEIPFLHQMKL